MMIPYNLAFHHVLGHNTPKPFRYWVPEARGVKSGGCPTKLRGARSPDIATAPLVPPIVSI